MPSSSEAIPRGAVLPHGRRPHKHPPAHTHACSRRARPTFMSLFAIDSGSICIKRGPGAGDEGYPQ